MNAHIEGERSYGPDTVLLHHADDLTARTQWRKKGYHIAPFLQPQEWEKFYQGVCLLFKSFFLKAKVSVSDKLELDKYHLYIGNNYNLHLAIVEQAKLLAVSQLPIRVETIEKRVSELCQVRVQAFNPFDQARVFHFRIIRPQSNDNNPLHRDVWLEDYKDCINIYVPIFGSNSLSSLTLVPGSHLWSEADIERTKKGAKVDGVQFNVPGLTGSKTPLDIVRPNPNLNEVLVFSPYLLHGGASNLNTDITRISLEMRFWRKP